MLLLASEAMKLSMISSNASVSASTSADAHSAVSSYQLFALENDTAILDTIAVGMCCFRQKRCRSVEQDLEKRRRVFLKICG